MGYLIERSVDPAGGFVQIAAVGINVHAYKNFGLSQTTTYYYRVRAFGSTDPASGVTDSFSPYSNVASGTTPADKKAPSTPSSLRAWAVACNQIALSWNSSTDGGTGVQAYNVFRGGVFMKQKTHRPAATVGAGGQGRGRTADLPLFRRTLVPTELPAQEMGLAVLTGLEPATSALTGRRALQLLHRTLLDWLPYRQPPRAPNGIRTRATALKGRRPGPLDDGGATTDHATECLDPDPPRPRARRRRRPA